MKPCVKKKLLVDEWKQFQIFGQFRPPIWFHEQCSSGKDNMRQNHNTLSLESLLEVSSCTGVTSQWLLSWPLPAPVRADGGEGRGGERRIGEGCTMMASTWQVHFSLRVHSACTHEYLIFILVTEEKIISGGGQNTKQKLCSQCTNYKKEQQV